MTDRELLELAAKAAGFEIWWRGDKAITRATGYWNPRTDDGDALRLAVKLKLGGVADEVWVIAASSIGEYERDPYAATRRAIVRAAAEIGKAMP